MFAHPFALFALLAVPAVVVLHLFRRRFEPRVVSAIFLWRSEDRVPIAGRKRERIVGSASFWLEIAASILLALAFAGPRAACTAERAQHLVVVLDSSASMGAVAAGASLDAKARALVRERIEALPRRSRVTLVRSGSRPSLIAGPAAFPAEALARLDEWKPLAARHDLAPALALALQLSGAASVLVVTDHFEPDAWPAEVELASIGEPVDNFAITHAARTRSSKGDDVFVTVSSFASGASEATLRVATRDGVLATRQVALEPRGRAHLSFEVPAETPLIAVELAGDALEVDNRVLLAPPPRRTIALASALPHEDARALGLSREAGTIDRWLATVEDSVDAGSPDAAHLLIGRGAGGGGATWCWSFEPLGDERKDLIGPFFAEKSHALLAGVTLDGVVWSIDPALALDGAPLVSAGNDPVLAEERSGERTVWRINLDPLRSSLQRSPDWPLLLANMAELRRAALPGPVRTNLVVGQTFEYRPGRELDGVQGALHYQLAGPFDLQGRGDANTREIPALGRVVVDDLEQAGAYRLSLAGAQVAEFTVSFADAAESDLTDLLPGRRESPRAQAEIDAGLSWVELALLACALAAVAADWWVLARATRLTHAS